MNHAPGLGALFVDFKVHEALARRRTDQNAVVDCDHRHVFRSQEGLVKPARGDQDLLVAQAVGNISVGARQHPLVVETFGDLDNLQSDSIHGRIIGWPHRLTNQSASKYFRQQE